jgi:hypothetical protein
MKVGCFMRVIQRSATDMDMADAKRPPCVINVIIKNRFNQKNIKKTYLKIRHFLPT